MSCMLAPCHNLDEAYSARGVHKTSVSCALRRESATELRDPHVFFHQIPIRHSRDIIAYGAMQSLSPDSFRRRLAQFVRIRQVRLENLPQHFAWRAD